MLIAVIVALGLLSRRPDLQLPRFVVSYAGDTLWAAMVFWLFAFLRPAARAASLAAAAMAFSAAVEAGQLYHAPWIDAIRATRLGALVLGDGFLWSDLLCYSVGVAMAAALDRVLATRPAPRPA